MAKVTITGIIKNNSKGNGFSVLEDYTVIIGDTKNVWQRRWQVWAKDQLGLIDDERVTIEGELGTKIDEYQNRNGDMKQAVSHSINNPVLLERLGSTKKVVDEDDLRKYGNAPF